MKHLPSKAISVITTLGLAVGMAVAQQPQSQSESQAQPQSQSQSQSGPQSGRQSRAGELLREYDQDNDMALSEQEFENLYQERIGRGGQSGDANQTFGEMDTNRDQQLSDAEVQELVIFVVEAEQQGAQGANQQRNQAGNTQQRSERAAQPTGEATGTVEQLAMSDPDRFEGESVFSSQGEFLGIAEIQEIVRSRSDDQLYAVVSSEEFFQIDDLAAVPLSEFRMVADDIVYRGREEELQRMFDQRAYQESLYQPLDEIRN